MSSESVFYSPENLLQVVPFLKEPPKWLLLGGPADAKEAQTARELWPGVRVVGVEPNPAAVEWQRANGWPEDAPLVTAALWSSVGQVVPLGSHPGSIRNAVLDPGNLKAGGLWVPTVTWDTLDVEF